MRRMYYHRFSGLRSCCIIIFLPILVILIFPILPPSSPSCLSFLFFSPSPLHFRSDFFPLAQVHRYWICQGQEPIVCCRAAIVSFFCHCHHHYHHFSRFLFSSGLFCVYHHMAGLYMASWIALVTAGMILVYMYYYDCYL